MLGSGISTNMDDEMLIIVKLGHDDPAEFFLYRDKKSYIQQKCLIKGIPSNPKGLFIVGQKCFQYSSEYVLLENNKPSVA